jgi:transcriptional regulator with XRE-family HTH domain
VKKTRDADQKNVIGARVRKAREAMKPPVSQEDLSGRLARLGVQITQTGLSRLENGERYVMDHEAAALAIVLKVRVEWLFEDALRVLRGRS